MYKIIAIPNWVQKVIKTGQLKVNRVGLINDVGTLREACLEQVNTLTHYVDILTCPTIIKNGEAKRRLLAFTTPLHIFGHYGGEDHLYWGKQILVNGQLVIDDALVVEKKTALRFLSSSDIVEIRDTKDTTYYAALAGDDYIAYSREMIEITQHLMYYDLFKKGLPVEDTKMEPFQELDKEKIYNHLKRRLNAIGFTRMLCATGVKRHTLYVVSGMAPRRIGIKKHSDLDLVLLVEVEDAEHLSRVYTQINGTNMTNEDLKQWTLSPELIKSLQQIFCNFKPNSLWHNPLHFKPGISKKDIRLLLGDRAPADLVARIEAAYGNFITPARDKKQILGVEQVLSFELDKTLIALGVEDKIDIFVVPTRPLSADDSAYRDILYGLLRTDPKAVLSNNSFNNQQQIKWIVGYMLKHKQMDRTQIAMTLLDNWFEYMSRDHAHIKLLVDDKKGRFSDYPNINGEAIALQAFLQTMDELNALAVKDRPFACEEWNDLLLTANQKMFARATDDFLNKLEKQKGYFDETHDLEEFWVFLAPYLKDIQCFIKQFTSDLNKYYDDTRKFLGLDIGINRYSERSSQATVHRAIGNFHLIASRVVQATIAVWMNENNNKAKEQIIRKAVKYYQKLQQSSNPVGQLIVALRDAGYFKDEVIPGSIYYYLCTAPSGEIKDELGIDRAQVLLFLLFDLIGSANNKTEPQQIFGSQYKRVTALKEAVKELLSGNMTYRGIPIPKG